MLKENSNQPHEPEIPDKQQASEPQDLELIPWRFAMLAKTPPF